MTRRLLVVVRTHARLLDLGLAALLAVVVVVQAATGVRHEPAIGTVALIVGAGGVGWRRRWPLITATIAIASSLIDHLLTRYAGPGQPAVLIGLYTVGATGELNVAVGTLCVAAVAAVVGQAAHGSVPGSGVALSLVPIVVAAIVGLLVAERRRERERERRLLAESAAAAERVRIARELHDVVAHHLSVMVVQANVVADSVADTGPTEAARAIVDSGRRALSEMRRILGVLRAGDASDGHRPAPRPGLAQLGTLVDTVSQAGVRVEVQIEGEEHELPEGLDLSAYRIVQEALTNTLRHARATQARVVVRYARDHLEIRVTDDGVGGASRSATGSGHGLAGMRERVAMFGGELSAGPADDQGYRVRAVLPL